MGERKEGWMGGKGGCGGDCLGVWGNIRPGRGYGLRVRGGGDIGVGRKSILWAFFGAWARFLVVGGADIPENAFCRCAPIKTAF